MNYLHQGYNYSYKIKIKVKLDSYYFIIKLNIYICKKTL